MTLTDEQIKEIKDQLIEQLRNLPKDQQESLRKQLDDLDNEQFEQFLIKNNLLSSDSEPQLSKQRSPFRLIVEGKIASYKVGENSESIAVLEINPLSKSHVLVIPKVAVDESRIPKESFELAEEISKKIKERLGVNETKISTMELFGEGIINIIPIYGENQISERKKASDEELRLLQKKLTEESKEKIENKVKENSKKPEIEESKESGELPKAPRRIP